MKLAKNRLSLLVAGAACTGMIACGPPTNKDDEEPVAVDHETTRQAISANTTDIASRLSDTIVFLEDSDLFTTGVEASGFGAPSTACAVEPGTEPTDDGSCEVEPTEEAVDLDVNDESAELTAWLEDHVFTEANVESEEEMAVTYLIDGQVFCSYDGEAPDADCVSQVDEMELRVVATSPSDGDIDLDILVGPNKVNPVSFQLHDDLLAAELDLGDTRDAADHIASITGDDIELPAVMEGRLRAELQVESDTRFSAALSVLSPVKVADGDYNFAMAPALPAFSTTVDAQAKTIESVSNIGAVDGSFPVDDYHYDVETDTETVTTYQAGFHLGGLTSDALFEASKDLFTVTGMGLGDTTSTFSVDGDETLAVDLNANDGRTLDATVAIAPNGEVDVEVSPKVDLVVALKFAAAADKLSDVADWMMDDVLRVTLDGAAKPTIRITEDGPEVLDGTLTMSLDNAGTTVTVEAGQCLLTADAPTVDGTTEEPIEPETETNPLEDVQAGTCQ